MNEEWLVKYELQLNELLVAADNRLVERPYADMVTDAVLQL
jgi:hypothetical protein